MGWPNMNLDIECQGAMQFTTVHQCWMIALICEHSPLSQCLLLLKGSELTRHSMDHHCAVLPLTNNSNVLWKKIIHCIIHTEGKTHIVPFWILDTRTYDAAYLNNRLHKSSSSDEWKPVHVCAWLNEIWSLMISPSNEEHQVPFKEIMREDV